MARKMLTKTSIKIDPETWKLAKKAAIDRGITLSEFLEKAVREELRGQYA